MSEDFITEAKTLESLIEPYASTFPRTLERLERRGYAVTTVDVSEIAKAEGAVTCCSLIFGGSAPR